MKSQVKWRKKNRIYIHKQKAEIYLRYNEERVLGEFDTHRACPEQEEGSEPSTQRGFMNRWRNGGRNTYKGANVAKV